jgi:hypothetical protein
VKEDGLALFLLIYLTPLLAMQQKHSPKQIRGLALLKRSPSINQHRLNQPNPTSLNGFDTLATHNEARIPANLIPIPISHHHIWRYTLQPPNAPFVDPNTGSVRSLSAFPSSPFTFPSSSIAAAAATSIPTTSPVFYLSPLDFPSSSPLADSPISVHDDLSSRETGHVQQSNSAQSSAPSPAEQNYDEQTTT